jgi:hypothetical protein
MNTDGIRALVFLLTTRKANSGQLLIVASYTLVYPVCSKNKIGMSVMTKDRSR